MGFEVSKEAMRTIKLLIEYDGTNYFGWQLQPQKPTIQGTIEEKWKQITGEKIHLVGSGRTDAGVHAIGQVAHFKTQSLLSLKAIQRALNSLLPPDIVIKEVKEMESDFHARKMAKRKVYEYRILNTPLPSVFHRGYVWHVPQPLDLEKVKRATPILIGKHDFSSFRSTGTPTKTAIREVYRAEWRRNSYGLIRFEIEANGFLKQMVRAIVGTLVEVGRGKIAVEDFQKILDSKDRRQSGPTAPAHGLFLKEVKYG